MDRMDKLSEYRTTIAGDTSGEMHVTYVRTQIVSWNADTVTLRSGGWRTVTTKRKMNQAANQFGLGFRVFQHDHDWFVRRPDGGEVPFSDGMTFKR